MKNKVKLLIFFNFILLLIIITFSVHKEESYKTKEGFYLELSPVDPRSLMQGDYMMLDYVVTNEAWEELREMEESERKKFKNAYLVLSLDENKVAHYEDIVKKPYKDENKIFISYKYSTYGIKINAETFFFQEDNAHLYEKAKYSKVLNINNTLKLIDLVDENKNILK